MNTTCRHFAEGDSDITVYSGEPSPRIDANVIHARGMEHGSLLIHLLDIAMDECGTALHLSHVVTICNACNVIKQISYELQIKYKKHLR